MPPGGDIFATARKGIHRMWLTVRGQEPHRVAVPCTVTKGAGTMRAAVGGRRDLPAPAPVCAEQPGGHLPILWGTPFGGGGD